MNVICPECGHENEPGLLYCVECDAALPCSDHTPIMGARVLVEQLQAHERLTGVGLYGAPSAVTLHVEGNPPLRIDLGEETTLGRQGQPGEITPNVDLSIYQALQKGVSRVHAVIRNHGNILTLTDLGSTNGTMLNGERLSPHKPRIIKSNNEIRLGKLALRIQFDS